MKLAGLSSAPAIPRARGPAARSVRARERRIGRRGWALMLAALAATACSSTPEGSGPSAGTDPFRPVAPQVLVEVRNQYELEVILHAYGPGVRERLGSLGPGRSAVYRVPWNEVGEIRVRVEPATGPHMESNALTVRPGDAVLFTVASDIVRSVLIYR